MDHNDLNNGLVNNSIDLIEQDLRNKAEVDVLVKAHGGVLVEQTATRVYACIERIRYIDRGQPQELIDQKLRNIHNDILAAYAGIDLVAGILRVGEKSEQTIDHLQELENVSD